MSLPSLRVPAYRHHKRRDLAYVRLNGKMIYLTEYVRSLVNPSRYEKIAENQAGLWFAAGQLYCGGYETINFTDHARSTAWDGGVCGRNYGG
jgi:hypothetical protein